MTGSKKTNHARPKADPGKRSPSKGVQRAKAADAVAKAQATDDALGIKFDVAKSVGNAGGGKDRTGSSSSSTKSEASGNGHQ